MKARPENHSQIKFAVILGELLLISSCLYICFGFFRKELNYDYFIIRNNFIVFFNLTYLLSVTLQGIVLHKRLVRMEEILDKVSKLVATHFILLSSIIVLTDNTEQFTFAFVITLFTGEFIFVVIWRLLFSLAIKRARTQGKNLKSIIILGAGTVAQQMYHDVVAELANGYDFQGFYDDRDEKDYAVDKSLVKGSLNDVIPFLKEGNINEIYCALPAGDDRKAIPIMAYAENNMIRFYLIPDFKRFMPKKVMLHTLNNIPIVSIRTEPLEAFENRLSKRGLDLVVSIIVLLTVFPISFLIFAPWIKWSSKGSIFFIQERTGKDGETFPCIKYRSMQTNEEANEKQATKNDTRVTKVGAFLRKTNLDELPQFVNVLFGQMSVVGPRPHMVKHTEEYSAIIDKFMIRHLAKPGITGYAQVTGSRGETSRIEEMEKRVRKDVWYLENWTFWLDVRIMLQTAWLMVTGDEKAY